MLFDLIFFWRRGIQIYPFRQKKRANTITNIFGLKKKRANTIPNIFGFTKKGEYEYRYWYSDWYSQIRIQMQMFVTHWTELMSSSPFCNFCLCINQIGTLCKYSCFYFKYKEGINVMHKYDTSHSLLHRVVKHDWLNKTLVVYLVKF